MTNEQLIKILESVKEAFSKKPDYDLFNRSGICLFLRAKCRLSTPEIFEIFHRFPVNNKPFTINMMNQFLFTDIDGMPASQNDLWYGPHKYDRAKWAESALKQLKKEMKNG